MPAITQAISTLCHNGRYRQLTLSKMLSQIAEGIILVPTGTYNANKRTAVRAVYTIIFTIASSTWKLFDMGRLSTCPCLI